MLVNEFFVNRIILCNKPRIAMSSQHIPQIVSARLVTTLVHCKLNQTRAYLYFIRVWQIRHVLHIQLSRL